VPIASWVGLDNSTELVSPLRSIMCRKNETRFINSDVWAVIVATIFLSGFCREFYLRDSQL
jgi:hypothetical protein